MQQIEQAIERAGSPSNFERRIGASRGLSGQWVKGVRPVPAHFCVKIEREWGVSRRILRPTDWGDIWPELIDAEHPWPPVAQLTQESA